MNTLFDHPSTPFWLQLIEIKLGANPALSTHLRPTRCRTCHAWTLEGYDSHTLAAHVHIHPALCTTHDETAAIILNIPTYKLTGTPGNWQLTPRYHPGLGVEAPTANADTTPVVHAHRCGLPIAQKPLPQPAIRTTDFNQPPPF
ncbi:hypothetical protein ACFSYH_02030 [Populibacterium corticicola]|uniref:Uncharacterized protein n=1 Tax=Populibacterium corticicola TaxID=1812826 RepID=A0ABW5XDH1_9MICO